MNMRAATSVAPRKSGEVESGRAASTALASAAASSALQMTGSAPAFRSCSRLGAERVNPTTSWPAAVSRLIRGRPMTPAAPATSTLISCHLPRRLADPAGTPGKLAYRISIR